MKAVSILATYCKATSLQCNKVEHAFGIAREWLDPVGSSAVCPVLVSVKHLLYLLKFQERT